MTVACPEVVEECLFDLDIPMPCAHPHHGEPDASHDEGPAVYWARTNHPCWGPVGIPYPVCSTYGDMWIKAFRPLVRACYWCGCQIQLPDQVFIVGKIE